MRLTERTLLLTTLGRAATTLTEVPITWHAAPSHVPFVQACATIVAREKVQLHLRMSKLPAAAAGARATRLFSPSLAARLLCAHMSRLRLIRLALSWPLPSVRRAAATSLALPRLALPLGSLGLQSLAPLLRDDCHLRTRVQRSEFGVPVAFFAATAAAYSSGHGPRGRFCPPPPRVWLFRRLPRCFRLGRLTTAKKRASQASHCMPEMPVGSRQLRLAAHEGHASSSACECGRAPAVRIAAGKADHHTAET